MNYKPVPPNALGVALKHVSDGGRLIVPTYTHCTVIDQKVVARFEAADAWLLKTEGDGYRLRQGRKSVYLFPGQLKFA